MKNILLILGTVLLFLSCEFEYKTQTITNSSAKTVSYTMFDYNETFVLAPGETRNHLAPHNSRLPPQSFSVSPAPHSVEMKTIDLLTYDFIDIQPIELTIINTLPVEIEISTGTIQYMDEDSFTIAANGKVENKEIFTKKPKFKIENSFPAEITYSLNEINTEMNVIIR